ncbi:nuclear transport factor 2 family protein [Bradyrhizobium sp. AS23.2]|uniref:nuclear transport factor 2 family protein n=1 Tax=Bradyrhizobium sp. AS23.2 TaxID=1680155 RepID=UPI00093AE3C9|nr:nuclear transport factor 2 family protein [Bradyrhizobium sp. AS23.2]OKO67185.1 polyketide cyclase [Bradyrhizobium sp. AS23.2]
MPINLPKPIAAYFAADATSREAVADCFTADATVIDERKTYRGRKAIQEWKAASTAKYSYVAEPIAIKNDGGQTVVTARVTGNFPGSPVDLHYTFTLDGDAISRLEIVQ